MSLLWNWCTLYVRGYENTIYILPPPAHRDCLLIWKSYCETVFPVSSVWKTEKCHFFGQLHFTICWYTYWLSNLFKNFGLFYHPQMVKGLPPPVHRDCLLIWKSYCGTVFLVSPVWKIEKCRFFGSLHFTIYRYTYWLSYLFNFFA